MSATEQTPRVKIFFPRAMGINCVVAAAAIVPQDPFLRSIHRDALADLVASEKLPLIAAGRLVSQSGTFSWPSHPYITVAGLDFSVDDKPIRDRAIEVAQVDRQFAVLDECFREIGT